MSLLQRHVELYEFSRGPKILRVADGDRPVLLGAQTYSPARGLKRGRIVQSATERATELGIDVPRSFQLLDWLMPFVPMERIRVKALRVRVADGNTRTLWSGVLADFKEGSSTVSLRCQTLLASMGANGLRRAWQVACPHALGGPACGVNLEAFRVDATLSGSTGYTVSAAAFDALDDGWFDGGFLRWTVGTDVEYRFVVSHLGADLTLLTPMPSGGGLAVAGYPGCAHSIAVCDSKFGNALDYGGQHTMPKAKHPFDGSAVF